MRLMLPLGWILLAQVTLGLDAASRALIAPTYVRDRAIVLRPTLAESVPVTSAAVFLTNDHGRTWHPVGSSGTAGSGLTITVPHDGHWGTYLVLENEAGTSGPAPESGTLPQQFFVIDTTPPLLQLDSATIDRTHAAAQLSLSIVSFDERIADEGVRLFWRSSDDAQRWRDGGSLVVGHGAAHWPLPPEVGPAIEIRLSSTDRAGNQTLTAPLSLMLVEPHSSSPLNADPRAAATSLLPLPRSARETQRAGSTPAEALASDASAPSPRPLLVDRNASGAPDGASDTNEEVREAKSAAQRLKEILQASRRDRTRGAYHLAAQRLRQAVQIAPQDPSVRIALGDVEWLRRDLDASKAAYAAARDIDPQHPIALEKLALVAFGRKEFAESESLLEQVVAQHPDRAPALLRLGDMQLRRGAKAEARTSWQAVLGRAPESSALWQKAEQRLATLQGSSEAATEEAASQNRDAVGSEASRVARQATDDSEVDI